MGGPNRGHTGASVGRSLGRAAVPRLLGRESTAGAGAVLSVTFKMSSFTIKMPSSAALENKTEASPNWTLGACKAVGVAAARVVLVRLKGPNEVRTKLAVKEYAVTYFCKVNFFQD